jgi:MFS family permease
VGGVVAAATFTRVVRRFGEPRVTLAYVPASALFGIACALAVNWIAAAVLLAGWAVSYSTVVLAAITMRQRVTPDHLQSRVNTAGRMLAFGVGWPIGAVVGGAISAATDPRTAIVAMSAPVVVGAVVAWLSPLRTQGRSVRTRSLPGSNSGSADTVAGTQPPNTPTSTDAPTSTVDGR